MIDYSKVLSERVQAVKPSGIRKFFDLASTMKDVISLGVGEPDFETPWQVRRAGIASLGKKDELSILQTGVFSSSVMRLQDWRCADMTCFMTRMMRLL